MLKEGWYPPPHIPQEVGDELVRKLSRSMRWNIVLCVALALVSIFGAGATHQLVGALAFAKEGVNIGYTTALVDAVTGRFPAPSVEHANREIVSSKATTRMLGYSNPGTLHHHHIKPWEDYTKASPATPLAAQKAPVAHGTNFAQRPGGFR